MPTYEYLCQTCSHRFETWQKMTDEPLTICPECGNSIRRVLFPAGIVFKGSGFYKTDHGNGALPASKKGEDGTSSENGSSTSSDSKAAENGASVAANKTSESKASSTDQSAGSSASSGSVASTTAGTK